MNIKSEIVKAFAAAFETRQRDNGETFVCLADGSPEWMSELTMTAHDGIMPEDWRYRMIQRAAGELADREPETWDDVICEIADCLVTVYNHELTGWLSSHLGRAEYVNDAVNDGLAPGAYDFDLFKALQAGQHLEYQEIISLILGELDDLADQAEPWSAGWNMAGY